MSTNQRIPVIGLACLLAGLAGGTTAQAAITTYTGSDDGAGTGGPWTQSAAAESSFMSAAGAFGSLGMIDFENQSVGYSSSYSLAPGVSVSLTGPNYGDGFSGISDTTDGNLYGFNVTSGGSKWLGFAGGTATFTFSGGTNAFGAYFTGLQTIFSSDAVVTFTDGTSETLHIPINADGGASYFGFTDSQMFSSLTLYTVDTDYGTDAWGIDNVSYGYSSAVPEPSGLALMMAGLVALGGVAGRRTRNR